MSLIVILCFYFISIKPIIYFRDVVFCSHVYLFSTLPRSISILSLSFLICPPCFPTSSSFFSLPNPQYKLLITITLCTLLLLPIFPQSYLRRRTFLPLFQFVIICSCILFPIFFYLSLISSTL